MRDVAQASKYRGAKFAAAGGLIGAAIGGPVGLFVLSAGAKAAVAIAGATGVAGMWAGRQASRHRARANEELVRGHQFREDDPLAQDREPEDDELVPLRAPEAKSVRKRKPY
eukprot:GABV01012478.1.p2 GENE.GABV01012478.1~~GABV01012478.1.p2  ORF type:complete len:128 (-),score=36.04 GABV01012478.1:6-341(-)